MATSGSRDVGRRLLELKGQLEEEKQQRSEMQGELKSLMARLAEEFGVTSLAGATALIKEQEKELETMDAELIRQVEEIERLMDGEEEIELLLEDDDDD